MPQGDLGREVAGLRGDVQVRHGGEEELEGGGEGLRAGGDGGDAEVHLHREDPGLLGDHGQRSAGGS